MINHLELNKENFTGICKETKKYLYLVKNTFTEEPDIIKEIKFLQTENTTVYFAEKSHCYYTTKEAKDKNKIEVKVIRRKEVVAKSVREKLHNVQENKQFLK